MSVSEYHSATWWRKFDGFVSIAVGWIAIAAPFDGVKIGVQYANIETHMQDLSTSLSGARVEGVVRGVFPEDHRPQPKAIPSRRPSSFVNLVEIGFETHDLIITFLVHSIPNPSGPTLPSVVVFLSLRRLRLSRVNQVEVESTPMSFIRELLTL